MIIHLWTQTAKTHRMEICALLLGLISLCDLNSAGDLKASGNGMKQQFRLREDRTDAAAPSMRCQFLGSARLPAFSMDGDFVIGGAFSLHHYKVRLNHNYSSMPEPLRCSGR